MVEAEESKEINTVSYINQTFYLSISTLRSKILLKTLKQMANSSCQCTTRNRRIEQMLQNQHMEMTAEPRSNAMAIKCSTLHHGTMIEAESSPMAKM